MTVDPSLDAAPGARRGLPLPTEPERAEAAKKGMAVALYARALPDEMAVISPSGDRTFRELNANANRLARALRARGLRPGDAVAIVARNRPEWVETVLACVRSGLRYTPVSWHLVADEVAYVVNDCGARAIVGDAFVSDVLRELVLLSPGATARFVVGGSLEGWERYEDAVGAEDATDLAEPLLGQRMLYTSGTTGRPKGVVRPPNYSTRLAAIHSAPRYRAGTGQRNLCTGPLYHGGPLSFSLSMPLDFGVGIVLMEKFDPERALGLVEKHRITHTHMVPTMFHRLLRLPEAVRRKYDVSSLDYILHGAAPCPVETKRAMMEWVGPILWEYYAATEGSGASASPREWLERPGTVGKPPTPDHVRILDEEGNECPPHQPGHIYLKRTDAMDFEYWNDPEKTERARRGGYFTVGDVGYLDDGGYLYLTDRSADVIVRGGVNVYPAEIEAVLLRHPAVHNAAVVGVPDPEWGEEAKGVVELGEGHEPSSELENELLAFCGEHLARFKVPRTLEFGPLPRKENGKLHRNQLRDRYRAGAASSWAASAPRVR